MTATTTDNRTSRSPQLRAASHTLCLWVPVCVASMRSFDLYGKAVDGVKHGSRML